MRTVYSADIMQPCEDFHHNRKSPSGFTLAAKGPKGPNGESKHNRRPPLTLQQVLVLREARRSQDKDGREAAISASRSGASACFLSSHRQRRSSFVFLSRREAQRTRPGLGSRHHCLQWRGFRTSQRQAFPSHPHPAELRRV